MLRLAATLSALLWATAAWAQAENIAKGVDVAAHAATDIADQGGILGKVAILVALAVLALVGWMAWQIKRRDDAIEARDKRIDEIIEANRTRENELQEKRIEEAQAHVRLYAEQNTKSVEAVSAQTHALATFAERVQGLTELVRNSGIAIPRASRGAS